MLRQSCQATAEGMPAVREIACVTRKTKAALKDAYSVIGIIEVCRVAARFAEENHGTPASEGVASCIAIALEQAARLSEEVHSEFDALISNVEALQ